MWLLSSLSAIPVVTGSPLCGSSIGSQANDVSLVEQPAGKPATLCAGARLKLVHRRLNTAQQRDKKPMLASPDSKLAFAVPASEDFTSNIALLTGNALEAVMDDT